MTVDMAVPLHTVVSLETATTPARGMDIHTMTDTKLHTMTTTSTSITGSVPQERMLHSRLVLHLNSATEYQFASQHFCPPKLLTTGLEIMHIDLLVF